MRSLFIVGTLPLSKRPKNGERISGAKFQSIFNSFLGVVDGVDDMFAYFYFNIKTTDETKWGQVELIECWHDRIAYVFEYVQSNRYHTAIRGAIPVIGAKTIAWFNQANGKYPVDIVFDSNPVTAGDWGKYLSVGSYHVPVLFRAEDGVLKGNDQVTGVVCDLNAEALSARQKSNVVPLFLSEHQKREYMAHARKKVKASVLADLSNKSKVVQNVISYDEIVSNSATIEKENKGVYIGALIIEKEWAFTVNVYDFMTKSGKLDGAIIMSMSDPVEVPSSIELCLGFSGKDYIQKAARSKVFVFNSRYESFGLVIPEAMAMGVIPVLPNLDWVLTTVPKDYPYLYKHNDLEHAVLVAEKALHEWEECHSVWKQYAKKFDVCTIQSTYRDIFAIHVDSKYRQQTLDVLLDNYGFIRILKKEIENLGTEFTLDDVYKSNYKLAEGRFCMIGRSDVVDIIKRFGYIDTKTSTPTFRKIDGDYVK